MSRFFPNAVRSFTSFFGSAFDLLVDGLRFLRLTVRSHSALGAEILFLRKQLAFYEERETQPRRLNDSARLSLVFWSGLFDWKTALVIVKAETLIGRHRKGFQLFWRWKSRAGRPRLPENIRKLIVRMALENPTWGQARVAAESVKLGIAACGPIGLLSRNDEGPEEPPRNTGGRLSAITLSPSSRVISSLSLQRGFEPCMCSC